MAACSTIANIEIIANIFASFPPFGVLTVSWLKSDSTCLTYYVANPTAEKLPETPSGSFTGWLPAANDNIKLAHK